VRNSSHDDWGHCQGQRAQTGSGRTGNEDRLFTPHTAGRQDVTEPGRGYLDPRTQSPTRTWPVSFVPLWKHAGTDINGPTRYRGPVSSSRVPGGVVHKLPGDLREALITNPTALDAWKDITPLARNEFICWVENAKQEMTRERRIRRTQEELEEGQRRPCCWPGCDHRERTGK
jgi:hypothetical protein